MKKKVILTILDGMGYRVNGAGNAVEAAKKPTFDMLQKNIKTGKLQIKFEMSSIS